MDYRILGSVEAAANGRAAEITGPMERALLARLLLALGRAVPQAQLIDDLWEGEPPESAAVSLRVLVSKLRKALTAAGAGDVLRTDTTGYRLEVGDEDRLDVLTFGNQAQRGHAALAAGRHAEASRLLRNALALWRGPALGGCGGAPFARLEAARLNEERLAVLEEGVEARLALGEHAQLVAELDRLCEEHPLHERLWGQRMVALYRCGRQADALAAFRTLQEVLREQLGIDPSDELRTLERKILKHDLTLSPPERTAALPTGVVTFLLTDIEGSTELWERHARAMQAALERHEQIIEDVTATGGGRMIKSRGEGDATLSVFQRASDAARAALQLQSTLGAEHWAGGVALRTRVALHTGEAQERGGDYFGSTVNRAARVRALARGGQILVSRATAELVRDGLSNAHLLELGERALRGLTRGEHVYELARTAAPEAEPGVTTAKLAPPALPEPLTAVMSGPFVGRDDGMARLQRAYTLAAGDARRVVLVSGEPGIGKTRLTAEFARSAADSGAAVLYGRCDEDAASPYQPFIEALRRWAGAIETSARAAIPQASHLVHLIPELGEVAAPQPREDPEVERYRFYDAVASTLGVASRAGSLVLILDDLHWADRPTLQLLRHVLRTRREAGVLIIGTYRESDLTRARPFADTLPELRREPGVERLRLTGLEEDDIVLLFERTVAHDVGRRGRALAHALCATTDGNPFFIEQVIGNLVETGSIVQREGRTVLETRIEDLAIPEGVIEAVGRRLSRLSAQSNQTLAAAAVLGREFEVGVLGRMVDIDTDSLLTAIDEAVDTGLVREVPNTARIAKYAFTHALVAQALYSELSLARKQRLHLRAADAIEAEHRTNVDAYVMAVARHLRAAGALADAAKTIDYSVRAMQASRRVFAFEEAIAHAEAALEIIAEAGADAKTHARVLESLGDLVYLAGVDYARGVSTLEEALRRYEALGDDPACARIHAKLGRAFGTFWGFIDVPLALRHIETAERLFGSSPDAATKARLLLSKATVLTYSRQRAAGQPLAQRARDLGNELGDRAIYSMATSLYAWNLMLLNERDEARSLVEEAWQIADSLDHLSAAFTATWTAGSYLVFDDAQECHTLLRRELEHPRQVEASNMREVLMKCDQNACLMMGNVEGAHRIRDRVDGSSVTVDPLPDIRFEYLAGDWERGRRMAEACVTAYQGSGNTVIATFALHLLGDILYAQGAYDESRRAHRNVADVRKDVLWWGDWSLVAQLKHAEVEAVGGGVETAKALISTGEAYLSTGTGVRALAGYVHRAKAFAAAAEGRFEEAFAAFETAETVFERYAFPFELAATLRAWGQALAAAGDAEQARERLDAAADIYIRHNAATAWIDQVTADRSRVE